MIALITDQGTAMPETALCGSCAADESNKMTAVSAADPRDWNNGEFVDASGNDQLTCLVCGRTDGSCTYSVGWHMDIDAESASDAAAQALAILRDPLSIATVFTVGDDRDNRYRVDIDESTECLDCGEYIRCEHLLDGYGADDPRFPANWVDETGGDCCPETNQPHRPEEN